MYLKLDRFSFLVATSISTFVSFAKSCLLAVIEASKENMIRQIDQKTNSDPNGCADHPLIITFMSNKETCLVNNLITNLFAYSAKLCSNELEGGGQEVSARI